MLPHWTPLQKIVYAVGCVVLTTAVLIWWGGFIKPYTDAAWTWLSGTFGLAQAAIGIVVLALASQIWLHITAKRPHE